MRQDDAEIALNSVDSQMPAAGLALQAVITGERGATDQSKDYFLRAVEAEYPEFDILCLNRRPCPPFRLS